MRTYGQRKSKLQERRVAQELGGRPQPASGATPFRKGDVEVVNKLLTECKTTGHKSYQLSTAELEKISAEAINSGALLWAMQIEFQGQLGHSRKVAVIDWAWFMELLENSK